MMSSLHHAPPRASVERSAPAGAKVATSEQMQPIYETKNTVLQNTKQLEAIQIHLRVSPCQLPQLIQLFGQKRKILTPTKTDIIEQSITRGAEWCKFQLHSTFD